MSEDLRIALVAEGPTDFEIIRAALKAVLPEPFILVPLQPESTQPKLGGGWSGVLKWCYEVAQRHDGPLLEDPTLQINPYDLIIIHLDVDVALQQYADCGNTVVNWATQNVLESLPCVQPCPPASDTADALVKVIRSWLGKVDPGDSTVFCLPAQSSGTWLAAAVLAPSHSLLADDAECDPTVENKLSSSALPKGDRIKKSSRQYRLHAPTVTLNWKQVKQICSQAGQFERSILAAMSSHSENPA